jgi:putative nucleotidyltransferase with HDIG domain
VLDRLRQFREANTGPSSTDLAFAKQHLPANLLPLLLDQEPRDIRHGVRTAQWLTERGDSDQDLIQAALLHDIGKGAQRRWDRVVYVVAGWIRLDGLLADEGSRFDLRKAVHRSLHHSRSGAEMLRQAGANERVAELTSLHHLARPQDDMLAALTEADAAS